MVPEKRKADHPDDIEVIGAPHTANFGAKEEMDESNHTDRSKAMFSNDCNPNFEETPEENNANKSTQRLMPLLESGPRKVVSQDMAPKSNAPVTAPMKNNLMKLSDADD